AAVTLVIASIRGIELDGSHRRSEERTKEDLHD
ncbi:signal peptidase II, partial [Burkholderia multivorans]